MAPGWPGVLAVLAAHSLSIGVGNSQSWVPFQSREGSAKFPSNRRIFRGRNRLGLTHTHRNLPRKAKLHSMTRLRGGAVSAVVPVVPDVLEEIQWPGRLIDSRYKYHPRPPPIKLADGTEVLPRGWNKTIVRRGKGQPPGAGEIVRIHLALFGKGGDMQRKIWTTKLKEGKRHKKFEFYSQMPGNQVIQGLDYAVATMKPGEVARVVVEPWLAYGERGHRRWEILPHQRLILRVELVYIYNRVESEELREIEREKKRRKRRRMMLGIPPPEQKVFKPWYIKIKEK